MQLSEIIKSVNCEFNKRTFYGKSKVNLRLIRSCPIRRRFAAGESAADRMRGV